MLSIRLRTLVNYSLVIFLTLFCLVATSQRALAQNSDKTTTTENRNEEVNLDTQLYLIVGTNQDVSDAKLPVSLDAVIKQLKSSLSFKNYRLVATLLNRVKTDGRLSLKWIGGPLLESAAETRHTPSFNEFNVRAVKLVDGADGRKVVRMDGFNFGARIPIQTSTGMVASNGAPPAPVVNYENTGLNTDISMREGEAVVVGTLNVGPSGDAIILIVSARRTQK
jgi:hypothetical protein